MSISFESAVATLKSMFPEWDEETLSTILMSNNYHVEQTIETVLSMGDTSGMDSQPRASPVPNDQPYAAPQAAPTAARQQFPPVQRPTEQSSNYHVPSSSAGNSRNRGLRCELPSDFLRPPNWHQQSAILADEELAMMLQNELFQSQAREMLGENFMRETYGPDSTSTHPSGRRGVSRVQPAGQQQQQDNADLGIMKALSSMGSAAKRNLTQLAQGFKSTGNTTTTNSGGGRAASPGQRNVRRGSGSSGVRKKGQFSDLDDDEEEGTEIITFSSNQTGTRSQHILQDGGSSGSRGAHHDGDDEEEDVLDSANPLLAHRAGTHNI